MPPNEHTERIVAATRAAVNSGNELEVALKLICVLKCLGMTSQTMRTTVAIELIHAATELDEDVFRATWQ
jgi:hypothetical protein